MKQKKEKTEHKVVFNVSTPRFYRLGFHPGLDPDGCFRKVPSKGDTRMYDIEPHQCKYKQKAQAPWTRMLEMEEFSRFLGFRNAPVLAAREFARKHCGPGTYNIDQSMDSRQRNSVFENVSFGCAKRFHTMIKDDNPPPDTYYRNIYAKAHTCRKQFSTLPSFEHDGFVNRFKSTEPTYRKAPNRYNVVDSSSLEALLKRVVSLKGPYNMFTGVRDYSSIKGFFAAPLSRGPDIFHVEPSDLDYLLCHPMKKRCGKFFQGPRFPKKSTNRETLNDLSLCYKDPTAPGPTTYDLRSSDIGAPKKSNLHPFNMSTQHAFPPIKWKIHPGPGRYNVRFRKCGERRKNNTSVFLSKGDRHYFNMPEEYADIC